MGQQVNVYRKLKLFPGAIVEGSFGDNFDRGGHTYYVNNITGSSTADGLSWNSAVSQISTAVTLSEASRLVHPGTTTNDYIRNTIVVQGTGTTYSAISALPSYCDLIGLGADPRGNGEGIVVVGDATGAADGIAGSVRGLNMYNIQCVGAGSYYGADFAIAYRSVIENCTFGGNAASAACAVGLNVVSGSGLTVRNCSNIAHAAFPVIGFQFAAAAGNFNQCLVEDNMAYGSTTGMSNGGYLSNLTFFRRNIGYGGTTGLIDAGAGGADGSVAFWFDNAGIGGTTGVTCSASATIGERHFVRNHSVGNTTTAIYYAVA